MYIYMKSAYDSMLINVIKRKVISSLTYSELDLENERALNMF
jgi:hypothetical protein